MSRLPGDPGVGRQALFALGARLPDRNREWVRHELTDADWRGRLIVRHLIVTLPFTAALALLPGALWIRIAVPALFLICSVGIVALYADDIRVSRLRRHGLEAPDDPDLGRPRTEEPDRPAGSRPSGANSISLRAASVMLPDRDG